MVKKKFYETKTRISMIKKNYIFAGFLILILSLSVVAFPLSADAQNSNDKGKPNVVSGIGKVPGKGLYVDVWVVVPERSDPQDMVAKALARQGAVPIGFAQFKETGFVWDQFEDNDPNNDFVTQNYISTDEPFDGLVALTNTHTTWNSVESSSFEFRLGDPNVTDRCPSLILECTPSVDRYFDLNNDMGWVSLGPDDVNTLGIAVWGLFTDEVDIALNSDRIWFNNGNDIDAETVLLHEEGHALGLDHSNEAGSIMNAFYGGVQRTLGSDDMNGISALYPEPSETLDPSLTITSPTTDIVNGRITISADVVGVDTPHVRFTITDPNGEKILDVLDLKAPFATSIHTKNWAPGYYQIDFFEETGSNLSDSKIVQKASKNSDPDEGPGGGPPCSKKPGHHHCL